MGTMFQPYIIATQNARRRRRTSASRRRRSSSSARWAAASRSPRSARCSPTASRPSCSARLGAGGAARVDTDRLLGGGASVPGGLSAGVQAALADALHSVFLAAVPLGLVALLLAVALPELPLRTWSGRDAGAGDGAGEGEGAPARAERAAAA